MTQPGMGHGDMIHDDMAGKDPKLAELLSEAYDVCLDLDVSAKHLWKLHQEAEFFEVSRELYEDGDFIDDIDFAMAADEVVNEDFNVDVPSVQAADANLKIQELMSRANTETPASDLEDAGSLVSNRMASKDADAASGVSTSEKWFTKYFLPKSVFSAMPTISVALMLVVSTSGFSMASQYSAPGDLLYGLKRGTEQARLAFTFSNESRSQLQVELANTRLQELRQVGTVKPEVVPGLIDDLNTAIQDAAQLPETASASIQIANAAQEEVNKLDLVAQEREQHVNSPVKLPVRTVVKVEVPEALSRQATKPETVVTPVVPTKPRPMPTAKPAASGSETPKTPVPSGTSSTVALNTNSNAPTIPALPPTGIPTPVAVTKPRVPATDIPTAAAKPTESTDIDAIAAAAAAAAAAIAQSPAGQVLTANGAATITIKQGDVSAIVNTNGNGQVINIPDLAAAKNEIKDYEPPFVSISKLPGNNGQAIVVVRDEETAHAAIHAHDKPKPPVVVLSTPQSSDGHELVGGHKDLSAVDTSAEDLYADISESIPFREEKELLSDRGPIDEPGFNEVLFVDGKLAERKVNPEANTRRVEVPLPEENRVEPIKQSVEEVKAEEPAETEPSK